MHLTHILFAQNVLAATSKGPYGILPHTIKDTFAVTSCLCIITLVQHHAQVGSVLLEHFDGQAARLVEAALGSAVRLVQLVAQYLPGFRDHAVYKGRQVRAG